MVVSPPFAPGYSALSPVFAE